MLWRGDEGPGGHRAGREAATVRRRPLAALRLLVILHTRGTGDLKSMPPGITFPLPCPAVGGRPIREGIGGGPGPAPPALLGRLGRASGEGLIGAGGVRRVGLCGRPVLGGGQLIRVPRVVPFALVLIGWPVRVPAGVAPTPVFPRILRLRGPLIQVPG